MFLGHCALHPIMAEWPKIGMPPPAFFQHVRKLEISLTPEFPVEIICANFDLPGLKHRHDAWDFHWLRLDSFKSLQSLKIWISTRTIMGDIDCHPDMRGIKQLNLGDLKQVFSSLSEVPEVLISCPLSSKIEPTSGTVEALSRPGFTLFKRGSGDRFHPFLVPVHVRGQFDGMILTSEHEEVRLGGYNGLHKLMPDF
ncbi:hypothetical protein BDZ85DRAFT_31722 [Elsinoe ampelina]|uniref:Uncharacterized protein n=1 Tax=Elsinoe ampelina TaxID=302913 RepID=A0A6A6G3D9_9PEZI|nr:hypothetical protein BDZ85DRAFT_31722 [Elsinoe ampelina]